MNENKIIAAILTVALNASGQSTNNPQQVLKDYKELLQSLSELDSLPQPDSVPDALKPTLQAIRTEHEQRVKKP